MYVRPPQPFRMPITCFRISLPPYTTDLITGFNPGTSPPPVRIPILSFVLTVLFSGRVLSRNDRWNCASPEAAARPLTSMIKAKRAHGEQLFQSHASERQMSACGSLRRSGTIAAPNKSLLGRTTGASDAPSRRDFRAFPRPVRLPGARRWRAEAAADLFHRRRRRPLEAER